MDGGLLLLLTSQAACVIAACRMACCAWVVSQFARMQLYDQGWQRQWRSCIAAVLVTTGHGAGCC